MPRRKPHRLAIFSLKPLNERAEAVLAHQCNEHLASWLNDKLVLDIGHVRSKSGKTTLATLGRGDADIFVEGSSIAKIQCSFEIDPDTSVVMFYDMSHSQRSQVFGQISFPFEHGRPRKVVVQQGINNIIGMGGVGRNLVQFELKWHQSPAETMKMVKDRESSTLGYEENPRLARTIDEADTVLPSGRETRVHTAGPRQLKLRYTKVAELGSGQFGDVYKAIDVDSGKVLAVKILRRPATTSEQGWRTLLRGTLKREPHIVDYIASWGWDGGEVEIFMGLKEGTLQSLVEGGCSTPVADLASTVLHHMLNAIDCLAIEGIVHRDVKPENILYVSRPGQYYFQLGDFGLSNHQIIAATFAGSLLYMAPEMFQDGKQTHKADVWSLYVTTLWTLDVEGFREASQRFKSPDEARKAILSVASNVGSVSVIREMANINLEERASAAQMLVKCYNGQGLTTPRNQIPPLASPTKTDIEAPSSATPAPASSPQSKPRHLRRKANPVMGAGQFRVEKAWHPQAQPQQPIRPVAKKSLNNVLRQQIPGGYPGVDTARETCKRPRYT